MTKTSDMTKTVEIDRHYDAAPEQVFAAWEDVTVLTRWWGCAPDMLWNVHTWDMRVGGKILVSLDFDGQPFEVEGEFLAVEAPKHLQFRFGAPQVVDVRIEAEGDGSRLYVTHSELPGEQVEMVTDGWSHALGALVESLVVAKSA